jgi:hypothetical protein
MTFETPKVNGYMMVVGASFSGISQSLRRAFTGLSLKLALQLCQAEDDIHSDLALQHYARVAFGCRE